MWSLVKDGIDEEEEAVAWREAALMTPVEYIVVGTIGMVYLKTRHGREDAVQ